MLGVGGVRCVGEGEVGDRTGRGAAVRWDQRVSFVDWRTGLIWYPGRSPEGVAQAPSEPSENRLLPRHPQPPGLQAGLLPLHGADLPPPHTQ